MKLYVNGFCPEGVVVVEETLPAAVKAYAKRVDREDDQDWIAQMEQQFEEFYIIPGLVIQIPEQ